MSANEDKGGAPRRSPALRLVWYSRNVARASYDLPDDGLFDADCGCGATLCGYEPIFFAAAEQWHFGQTAKEPRRLPCGPQAPGNPLGSGLAQGNAAPPVPPQEKEDQGVPSARSPEWERREAYRALRMVDDASWGEFCGYCGVLLSLDGQDEECGQMHTAVRLAHEWLERNPEVT